MGGMAFKFLKSKDCKHSVVYKATEAWADGEKVLQDLHFSIYVPRDVLAVVGDGRELTIKINED